MRSLAVPLALLAVGTFMVVDADLPVHCLHAQVVGDWTFHRGPASATAQAWRTCNKAPSAYLGGGDFGLGEPGYDVHDKVKVSLSAPNHAHAVIAGKKVKGTWTMMYDEGFEVVLGTQRYFAFSKYTGAEKSTISHCDKTFPGWYHTNPEEKTWGCYHATKDTAVAPQAFRRFGEGKSTGFQRNFDGDIVAPRQSTQSHSARHAMPTANEKDGPDDVEEALVQVGEGEHLTRNYYDGQDELVEAVNKGHAAGKHTWHAINYPHRPMKAMGVVQGAYKGLGEAGLAQMESYRQAVADKVDVSDIPTHFDWSNVKGKNFVPGVRNQKCGSCYAFATRDMMEARTAIMDRKPVPQAVDKGMSVQAVLSCNAYSQGCAGGFPYTVAKFYQDFGAAGDKDQPSNADWSGPGAKSVRKPDKLSCDTKAKPIARAYKYGYVGGFYGATNEKSMQRDIFDHGPLAVCFQVGLGFGNYRGGVFKQTASLPVQDHYGRVNHAVLITGFGETASGHKYWKVKNSWGDGWGDQGYFKIERGTNQLNMEGDAVAVYPSKGPKGHEEQMALGESIGSALLEEEESLAQAWRENA